MFDKNQEDIVALSYDKERKESVSAIGTAAATAKDASVFSQEVTIKQQPTVTNSSIEKKKV